MTDLTIAADKNPAASAQQRVYRLIIPSVSDSDTSDSSTMSRSSEEHVTGSEGGSPKSDGLTPSPVRAPEKRDLTNLIESVLSDDNLPHSGDTQLDARPTDHLHDIVATNSTNRVPSDSRVVEGNYMTDGSAYREGRVHTTNDAHTVDDACSITRVHQSSGLITMDYSRAVSDNQPVISRRPIDSPSSFETFASNGTRLTKVQSSLTDDARLSNGERREMSNSSVNEPKMLTTEESTTGLRNGESVEVDGGDGDGVAGNLLPLEAPNPRDEEWENLSNGWSLVRSNSDFDEIYLDHLTFTSDLPLGEPGRNSTGQTVPEKREQVTTNELVTGLIKIEKLIGERETLREMYLERVTALSYSVTDDLAPDSNLWLKIKSQILCVENEILTKIIEEMSETTRLDHPTAPTVSATTTDSHVQTSLGVLEYADREEILKYARVLKARCDMLESTNADWARYQKKYDAKMAALKRKLTESQDKMNSVFSAKGQREDQLERGLQNARLNYEAMKAEKESLARELSKAKEQTKVLIEKSRKNKSEQKIREEKLSNVPNNLDKETRHHCSNPHHANLLDENAAIKHQMKIFKDDFKKERAERILVTNEKKAMHLQLTELQKKLRIVEDAQHRLKFENDQLRRQTIDYRQQTPKPTKPTPRLSKEAVNELYKFPDFHSPPPLQALDEPSKWWLRESDPHQLSGSWNCRRCTYRNVPMRTVCEVCGEINQPPGRRWSAIAVAGETRGKGHD